MKTIDISSTVKEITSVNVFDECESLEAINVKTSEWYKSINGVLIDIKNQHGDIKIATYDYEFGSIKKAVFDNRINIYLKNGPEGELIRVNKDDEDAEEYILINI